VQCSHNGGMLVPGACWHVLIELRAPGCDGSGVVACCHVQIENSLQMSLSAWLTGEYWHDSCAGNF